MDKFPVLRRSGGGFNFPDEMKIVIVEDHLMFREILRKVCARDLHHEVTGEAIGQD